MIPVKRCKWNEWYEALRVAIGAWLLTRLLFSLLSLLASTIGSQTPIIVGPRAAALLTHTLLDRWVQWDAWWYLGIAFEGYPAPHHVLASSLLGSLSQHGHTAFAFFPLYPLGIRALATLGAWLPGGIAAALLPAALIVANLSTLIAFAALYRLTAVDHGVAAARRAVVLLAFFPTGLFTAAPYSEGLFLALSTTYLLAVRKRRWTWAAGLGIAAGLCRPTGIALALAGVAAGWSSGCAVFGRCERSGFVGKDDQSNRFMPSTTWRTYRGISAASVAPGLGIGLYAFYLWFNGDSPLAFGAAQRAWHRAWTWPWVSLWEGLARPLHHFPELSLTDIHALTDAGMTLLLLGLTALCWSRLRRDQAVYLLAFWIITLTDPQILDDYPAPLSSVPRFALAAIPLFVGLATFRRLSWLIIGLEIPYLIVNTLIFVHQGWVA